VLRRKYPSSSSSRRLLEHQQQQQQQQQQQGLGVRSALGVTQSALLHPRRQSHSYHGSNPGCRQLLLPLMLLTVRKASALQQCQMLQLLPRL
jgi:hypothetical protein